MQSNRPRAPGHLLEILPEAPAFVPAPELERWIFETFIDEGSPLENPEPDDRRGRYRFCVWKLPAMSGPKGKAL